MVFVMQTCESEEDGEDVGAAFSGFSSPAQMVMRLIQEAQQMAAQAGIIITVEKYGEPGDYSQN